MTDETPIGTWDMIQLAEKHLREAEKIQPTGSNPWKFSSEVFFHVEIAQAWATLAMARKQPL